MKLNPAEFLRQIIKDEYIHLYDANFFNDLNHKQKQGFHLLKAIYRNKGMKKFRQKPPSVILRNAMIKTEQSWDKTEQQYQKRLG